MKLIRIYASDDGKLWVYLNGSPSQVGSNGSPAVIVGDVIDGNDSSWIFDGGKY